MCPRAGSVLKIADMGQSRILQAGQTGMDTGTMGGTMGWMSPEEIKWENARQTPPLARAARLPLSTPWFRDRGPMCQSEMDSECLRR